MPLNLIFLYLLVTVLVFLILLSSFLTDRSTPKGHRISWGVILLGAVLWPLTIPLSMVERGRKLAARNLSRNRSTRQEAQKNPSQ